MGRDLTSAGDQRSEELADALRAAADRNHGDGAAWRATDIKARRVESNAGIPTRASITGYDTLIYSSGKRMIIYQLAISLTQVSVRPIY